MKSGALDEAKLSAEAVQRLTLAEEKDSSTHEVETKHSPHDNITEIVTNAEQNFRVASGLRILEMSMRDCRSAKEIWHSTSFAEEDSISKSGGLAKCFRTEEMTESIPKAILQCRAVSREIRFSSIETIRNFKLKQRVHLHGQCVEEWNFTFGFVMPGSVNSWQQMIEAAPTVLPAEVLSGNVIFETSFFDGEMFLCKSSVRLYYV
eukprot:GSChrysophyteH1.ASY1.ANO1.802.1 assembled CDS